MSRFRKWNAAHNWDHARGKGGRFVGKTSRPKITKERRAEIRVIRKERREMTKLAIYEGAPGVISGASAVAFGISTGRPFVTGVGAARIATSVALTGNQIHSNYKIRRGKRKALTTSQYKKHEVAYLRRAKIIDRSHAVTGRALQGTGAYFAARQALSTPEGQAFSRSVVRTPQYRAAAGAVARVSGGRIKR